MESLKKISVDSIMQLFELLSLELAPCVLKTVDGLWFGENDGSVSVGFRFRISRGLKNHVTIIDMGNIDSNEHLYVFVTSVVEVIDGLGFSHNQWRVPVIRGSSLHIALLGICNLHACHAFHAADQEVHKLQKKITCIVAEQKNLKVI